MSKQGYKYCLCQKLVPGRINVCGHCGHEFKKGEKFAGPKELTSDEIMLNKFGRIYGKAANERLVHTPNGNCEIKYEGDMLDWINAIISIGKENNILYSPFAIKYFAKDVFGYKSKLYNKCVKILDNMISEVD